MSMSAGEQLHIISAGASNIVPLEDLKKKLERGTALNIKLGVDPTSPDLHLGHAVTLHKMRQFQELGHKVTLIIGDGTALIGDPSGKNSTRPQLTRAEIDANAATYVEQAVKVLDTQRLEIKHNADWICSMDLEKLLSVCSKFTVARILERDDFSKRYHAQTPIALHEFLYPVMQAYDSVMINADVEMGGNDQLFNLLAGRELMEKMGMEPQVCFTMPLLEGTDGTRKMSKSYGNYVGLTDAPDDMFGKIMSIPDAMIVRYYRLASPLPVADVDRIERQLASGELDPNRAKRALARSICNLYHGEGTGEAAEEHFNAVFRDHSAPEDIDEKPVDLSGAVYLPALLHAVGFAGSSSEGRRLIDGGGVRLDGEPVAKGSYELEGANLDGVVLQAGKRRFVRLVAQG